MQDDRVVYDFVTGRPPDIATDVLRSLSAFTRHDRVRYFKIGITSNPERRFKEAYAKSYDEMIVLYRSTSIHSVSQLEIELVRHNEGLADNLVAGGGGDYGEPPYYLYVVMKHKARR